MVEFFQHLPHTLYAICKQAVSKKALYNVDPYRFDDDSPPATESTTEHGM